MVLSHLMHTQETHQSAWKGKLEASGKPNILPWIMPPEKESPSAEVIYSERDNTLSDIPHGLSQ
jgi:hypothetical protein